MKNMIKQNLEPCPSCGGKVKIVNFDKTTFYKTKHFCIECCDCKKNYAYDTTGYGGIYKTKKECIENWNKLVKYYQK